VLARAQTDGGTYSFESAYALVGSEASKAADVLLDAGDAGRWKTFAEATRLYGAEMVQSRQPSRDLADALDHLLALHCGSGSREFFTLPDHVKLDTGPHCGPLGGNLELAWKGAVVARAPCTTPLPAATLGWRIRQDGAARLSLDR
jgi:hypothetical protein